MVEGTENKVDNFVGKHTVAELHNHPNGTPPSFQDVLYTAKQAADTAIIGYKATFVYNAKDDSFYALYVHDRDKAARFYEEIKDQIDSEMMMFKDKPQIQTILEDSAVESNLSPLLYCRRNEECAYKRNWCYCTLSTRS